jgi:hypothetical protein
LFVEQLVDVDAPSPWTLRGSMRGDSSVRVNTHVCEKTLIQSFDCMESRLPAATGGNQWQSFERTIDLMPLVSAPHSLPRLPATFALSAGGETGSVDLALLRLEDARGASVLKNSDFHAGSAHWFFTSDDHLAWHAKNLWVHLFVEQGWLGLGAFAWLSIGTLGLAIYRAVHYPDLTSWVLALSIAGILSMGLFDSLVDAPWIAQLLCLLMAVSQSIACRSASRQGAI